MADGSVHGVSTNRNSPTEVLTADFINAEFRDHVLPVSIIMGLFAIAGFIGNTFVLYVHLFRYRHNTFRYFVLGLCFIDLGCSVTIIPMEIITQMYWFVFPDSGFCKAKSFLTLYLSVASVYVLLMIAIDRHRKVCVPHGWQLRKKNILRGFAICLFLSLVQSLPVILFWGKQYSEKNVNGVNITVTFCSVSETFKNTDWPKLTTVLLAPMPIGTLVMLVLYCLVARQIYGVVVTLRRQSKADVTAAKSNVEETKAMVTDERESVPGTSPPSQGGRSRILSDNTTDSSFDRLRSEAKLTSDESSGVEMVIYKIKGDEIAVENRKASRKAKNVSIARPAVRSRLASDNTDSSGDRLRQSDTEELEVIISDENQNPANDSTHKRTDTFHKKSKKDARKIEQHRKIKCANRLKRRTLMTFIFTAIFIITFVTYVIFQGRVLDANTTSSFQYKGLVVFQLFYRLYFINCVIHPIIYGFLDPRFRKTLKSTSRRMMDSVMRSQNG